MTSTIWSATTGADGAEHVVLIHGSLDRSAGMLKLSRRLDTDFRVTRYDRRGYGRSIGAGEPYGVDQQVADLIGVLDASDQSSRPALLVGHSYGGNVALAAAEQHPSRVAGVVTYESPLSWLEWWPTHNAWRTHADPGDAAERFMRRLVGDDVWERLPPATRAARRLEGPALVGELAALAERAPWTPAGVRVPVLPMRGERAVPHHVDGVVALAAMLGAEPVVIEGARHFGPNTHPDQVAAEIRRFAATCFPTP
jgi:pimeloyl-ACP methyl ester carboxylesterase